MTTAGSPVFVAGSFQNANGVATADDIAYFDGRRGTRSARTAPATVP